MSDNEYANCGKEITKIKDTGLHAVPIKIDDIYQKSLQRLNIPHDVIIAGNRIRVYAGTVINITSRGITSIGRMGVSGKLTHDLRVKCLDGVERILPAGRPVEIITE